MKPHLDKFRPLGYPVRDKEKGMIQMQEEQMDKRQKVLNTTLHMILENGIQATSMAKVSKRSGVAVGTIYHHFPSKEALITELYRSIKLGIAAVVFEGVDTGHGTQESFERIVRNMIAYARENPEAYAFVEGYCTSPEIDPQVKSELFNTFQQQISDLYDKWSEGKRGRHISVEMLNLYLNGALSFLIRACISEEIDWEDPQIETYIHMIWQGMSNV